MVPEVAREELYGLSGNGMWVPTANTEEHTRRSIYMLVAPHVPARDVRELRRAGRHSELLAASGEQYGAAIAHAVERPVDGEGSQPPGGKTRRASPMRLR